ncbi:MAG: CRISPR-associated protein Cas2 [Treponema sp.]|jgi:CRISPR-associated protein Cas2|nr:CRISPR-associated protein Cas2 [Treponema sp.]
MFVSIALDPGGEGRAKELAELLIQYGFDKIQRGLWESTAVSPETLGRLKRDLDRSTDAFDRIRIFQFPVEGTLVLSTLRDKKWRRLVARGGEVQAVMPLQTAAPVQVIPVRRGPVRTIRRGR